MKFCNKIEAANDWSHLEYKVRLVVLDAEDKTKKTADFEAALAKFMREYNVSHKTESFDNTVSSHPVVE